jgi:hypothetical protein
MAGLVPAIHVFAPNVRQRVDARHKAAHDETGVLPYLTRKIVVPGSAVRGVA